MKIYINREEKSISRPVSNDIDDTTETVNKTTFINPLSHSIPLLLASLVLPYSSIPFGPRVCSYCLALAGWKDKRDGEEYTPLHCA